MRYKHIYVLQWRNKLPQKLPNTGSHFTAISPKLYCRAKHTTKAELVQGGTRFVAVCLQRRRLFVLNARVEAQCAYCASIVQGMSRMKKHVRSQTPCAKLQRAIYTLTVSVKKSCQKSTDLNDFSVHRILKKFYIQF